MFGFLCGVLDMKWLMIFVVVSYWFVGVSIGYVFGFLFGFEGVGVWFGLVVGFVCVVVLLMWWFW